MHGHHHLVLDGHPSCRRRRSRPDRRAAALALTIAALGCLSAPALASAASTASTPWNVTIPPFPAADAAFAPLYSISAVSAKDVWAVGEAEGVLLTDHFNGTRWSSVALPPGPCSTFEADCALSGVSGDAAGDVIAVGHGVVAESSGWVSIPLAFQWNGSAWSAMTVPSTIYSGALEHVQTFSPTDAWAVGSNDTTTPERATAAHWNGKSWANVATPISVKNAGLSINAISGSSPTDIWVVGETETGGYGARTFTSVIMHYNGLAWTTESVPDQSGLLAVDDLSPTDAWAVAADGSILNWNGVVWTVSSVQPYAAVVTALSPTDVWVADEVSIAHYNGVSWTSTPAPKNIGELYGATSVAPSDVWFSGIDYASNGDEVPLVLSMNTG